MKVSNSKIIISSYFIAIISSMLLSALFYHLYLMEYADSTSSTFQAQNSTEIEASNIYKITDNLNRLKATTNWVCLELRSTTGLNSFFFSKQDSCESGLLKAQRTITNQSNTLEVLLTLRLPPTLEKLFIGFLVLEFFILALSLWASRIIYINEIKSKEQLTSLASQIAHDIRSPLAALSAIVNQDRGIENTNRQILEKTVERINSIAENLLSERRGNKVTTLLKEVVLDEVIQEIITEKKLLHPQIRFELNLKKVGSSLNSNELKRILSNLLNNSIEAMNKPEKKISITLSCHNDQALLKISDNGKGIPKHIVDQLFKEGKSVGKEKGNGLGLYHAKQAINSWGGEIELLSEVGVGTTINIKLPAKLLEIKKALVILIDDDALVRLVWESKAKSKGIELITFDSTVSFEGSLTNIPLDSEIYIDRDLPDNIKGEEYAKILYDKGFANLILATGHERDMFGDLPYLKRIIGKEAPW